jgi:hypothetical protein
MTDDLVKRLRELGSKQHADPSTAPEFVFLDPDLPPSEWEKQYSMDVVYVRADRIEALTAEVGELQEVFDFQWRAHMRAVEMWRTANPGNELVLPDSAKLTVWMLEQLEAARADAKEAEVYADELAGDQVDLCRQLIAAEDKLAKAVEALRGVMQHMPDYADTVWQDARATLAEIEGEKP